MSESAKVEPIPVSLSLSDREVSISTVHGVFDWQLDFTLDF